MSGASPACHDLHPFAPNGLVIITSFELRLMGLSLSRIGRNNNLLDRNNFEEVRNVATLTNSDPTPARLWLAADEHRGLHHLGAGT